MRKILCVALALIFTLSFVSCNFNIGDVLPDTWETYSITDTETESKDTEKLPEEDKTPNFDGQTVEFKDKDGDAVVLEVKNKVDITKFKIVRADLAGADVKKVTSDLRMAIKDKTGEGIKIITDFEHNFPESAYEIILTVGEGRAEGFTVGRYDIVFEGNKVHLLAGSPAALSSAAERLVESFVDSENLIFAENYAFIEGYYLGNVEVDGVNISDFKVTFDPEDYAISSPEVVSEKIAHELSENLICLDGEKTLSFSDRMMNGNHYIVISAHSLDVDAYSIRIEQGNIYVEGSVLSINRAVKELIKNVLGGSKYFETIDTSKTLKVSSKNNVSGKIEFEVPYTKAELLAAIEEANARDDMIITGGHAWNWNFDSNGIAVGQTVDRYESGFGECAAVIEFDLGQYSALGRGNNNTEGLSTYDISKLLSDSAEHVAKGGIISISAHIMNPLSPSSGFRGTIGSDAKFREIYTEGTALNRNFHISNNVVYTVLKAFHDNGIPVIYRPFHEMTGNWFWWCVYQQNGVTLQKDTWVGLWRYLHDYVTNDLGLDNVIWSYATAATSKSALYQYPGDEYVDLVGIDWYTEGNREIDNDRNYSSLMAKGKPIGLTEFGGPSPSTGYNCKTFLQDLKWMIDNGLDISFFVVWTTNAAFNGMGFADVLFGDPIIYSRADMLEYWNK